MCNAATQETVHFFFKFYFNYINFNWEWACRQSKRQNFILITLILILIGSEPVGKVKDKILAKLFNWNVI